MDELYGWVLWINFARGWPTCLQHRDAEPPHDLGEDDAVGEDEAVDDDLDDRAVNELSQSFTVPGKGKPLIKEKGLLLD